MNIDKIIGLTMIGISAALFIVGIALIMGII